MLRKAVCVEQYEAHTVDELATLGSRLHDAWLDLPDDLAAGGGEVVMSGYDDIVRIERPPYRTWGPFAFSHKTRAELVLTIRRVSRVDVVDEAEIGGVSVNMLRYDAIASTLAIVPNIPTDVTFIVEAIDLRLVVTDMVRRRGRRWSLNLQSSSGG
jgi:hypothetical protein